MVSFSRKHTGYRFVGGLAEGPTGWRDPLARGTYWLEGPIGQRGLLGPEVFFRSFDKIQW